MASGSAGSASCANEPGLRGVLSKKSNRIRCCCNALCALNLSFLLGDCIWKQNRDKESIYLSVRTANFVGLDCNAAARFWIVSYVVSNGRRSENQLFVDKRREIALGQPHQHLGYNYEVVEEMGPYLENKESNGLRVGYIVKDEGHDTAPLDPRLPLLQHADLKDKIVLLRVDHNVVKKGKVMDQYRIDVTLATMYNIIERGGRLIIMTHIGRPYDKKTKTLTVSQGDAVDAVVGYLQRKLRIKFALPQFHVFDGEGIHDIDTSINWLIQDLRDRKIGGIYLPNTRWFAGEEDKGEKMERFAVQLAALADVFVNDAFGSWQAHTSTYHVTKYLPSFAGLCMQDELSNVRAVLEPKRPFVAIVAGAKYDTKIGPLTEIYKRVDQLILGGLIYNTFLCAKYGVKIKGVEDADILLAKGLVEQDKKDQKILELPLLVESDTLEGRIEGKFRIINTKDFRPGHEYQFVVDVDPSSFETPNVLKVLDSAKTVFVNAVMGLMPAFWHGTSKMDECIDRNRIAQKFFGGGDTLQTFKSLHPGLYHAALESPKYYLFTGGGTVLKVLEEADPFGLPTVKALIENGDRYGYQKVWPGSS